MESLSALSQTGFRVALIQRLGCVVDYLDTAWTLLVLRGVDVPAGAQIVDQVMS